MAKKTCSRCGGLGKIQAYAHVNGGTCFKCGGSGKVDSTASKSSPKNYGNSAADIAAVEQEMARIEERNRRMDQTPEELAKLPTSFLNRTIPCEAAELARRYYASGTPIAELTEAVWAEYNLLRCGNQDQFYVVSGYDKEHKHAWLIGEGSAHPYIGEKVGKIVAAYTIEEVREELKKLGVDRVRGHKVYNIV